jgi:hypothetical protein
VNERRDTYEHRYDEPLVAPDAPRIEHRVEAVREDGQDRPGPDAQAPLFSPEETTQLRTRWESVQASFVDEPRRAVEEADGLVRQVMDRLTDGFTHQRERLEQEWDNRDDSSTEDLRVALRHYRSFFDRLLRL